ncbi:uncharacterized protein DMAD_02615 [Drosophila madeirensis]|uniref:Uncharacterized protein n=1 Tax=Drosophila madeirensis TaxID=30013 RepID=A0AAU9G6M7_DROMD
MRAMARTATAGQSSRCTRRHLGFSPGACACGQDACRCRTGRWFFSRSSGHDVCRPTRGRACCSAAGVGHSQGPLSQGSG